MNYPAALTDFFKSPKWVMNLLLGSVCFMIPAVGPFVFMGWLITGFWGRDDQRPETFPDFDFNHFVKYMERGLWPFLVSLVTSLVIAIPMMVLWFGFIFGVVGMDSRRHGAHGASEGPGLLLGLGFVAIFLLFTVLILLVNVILVPLMVRAARTQDFKDAFSFAWAKDFVSRMWLDIVVSMIVLWIGGMALMGLGYVMFCVGALPAMVLIQYAWFHLKAQLYTTYLSRGGIPVELSPKLRAASPPPLAPPGV